MTRNDKGKPDDPHPADERADAEVSQPHPDPPRRVPRLPSRMLERAAMEQLSGPFGKLGRYALKRHGVVIPSERAERPREAARQAAEKEGLFSRLFKLLKRPFE